MQEGNRAFNTSDRLSVDQLHTCSGEGGELRSDVGNL